MSDSFPEKLEANFYPSTDTTRELGDEGMEIDTPPAPNAPLYPRNDLNIVPAPGGSVMDGGDLRSPNFVAGISGWRIGAEGNIEANDGIFRGNLVVGNLWKTIDNTDDIQDALDELNTQGGGTLYLKSGTYTLASALTGYSSVAIIGISPSSTIIDFNSTSANLSFTGSDVYTTGTITVASGVNITGDSTVWTASMAGRHLFLGTRWYQIASVTDSTHLVLAEAYGDNVSLPSTYRIASVVRDVTIKNVMLKNSTGTGLVFTDARQVTLQNVFGLDNNKNFVFTNCSEFNADQIIGISATSNGMELTNFGLSDFESVNMIGNGGSGFVFNNVKTSSFEPVSATGNTADGLNITTGVDLVFLPEASGNGGQGIELVATCDNVVIRDGPIKGNTSDGIKLTATSDTCRIYACSIVGNGAYGINIAASTCDNNIIALNYVANNSSGQSTDSGTGTLFRSNIGITDAP